MAESAPRIDINSDMGESFGRWTLGTTPPWPAGSPAPTWPAAFPPPATSR